MHFEFVLGDAFHEIVDSAVTDLLDLGAPESHCGSGFDSDGLCTLPLLRAVSSGGSGTYSEE